MKKTFIPLAIISALITIGACKSEKKPGDAETQSTTSETKTEAKSTNGDAAAPKTYTVTATPDSVSLGRNKEAFIKLKNMEAVELTTPDGQVTGIEFRYKIELTNRNPIGGSSVGLPTTDFRLELDNGNKISPSSVFVGADAESTKLSEFDKFQIPAGAKPVALNLFYDQTRATVKLDLK